MSATITTSVVTGGSNSHATTSAEVNAVATDFVTQGVNGTITSTSGVAPTTGSFAVNAQGTPAMFVDVTAGTAWITATPSGQSSQELRASMTSSYLSYTISANASGSTKYDWIYLKVDPTKANNPASDASDVTALFTSRSSSSSSDNGSPPTYGILLAVVTVANGASSITNGNIADGRTQSTLSSPASLQTYIGDNVFDHVVSGCVWSGDSYASTLNASMTAGVIYIGGKRVSVSAVSARAFTASKDTYIDVDNTGTFTYTANTTNAASPALAANNIRLGIIVAGASNIAAATSVNQGQESMVLPIASSIPYSVSDSLGNLICPRDPNRRILGYSQLVANVSTTATPTITDVTGLSTTVNVPTGRKVRVTAYTSRIQSSQAAGNAVNLIIREGSTTLNQATHITPVANYSENMTAQYVTTPTAGVHTYKVSYAQGAAGTLLISASATELPFLLVELV